MSLNDLKVLMVSKQSIYTKDIKWIKEIESLAELENILLTAPYNEQETKKLNQ